MVKLSAAIIVIVLLSAKILKQNRLIEELTDGLYPFRGQLPPQDLEFYYNKANRLYRKSRGK